MIHLDWYEINKNYPIAWSILEQSLAIMSQQNLKLLVMKDNTLFVQKEGGDPIPFIFDSDLLFKVFDHNNVLLNIFYNKNENIWTFKKIDKHSAFSIGEYTTRQSATEAGFLFAFEILNNSYEAKGVVN